MFADFLDKDVPRFTWRTVVIVGGLSPFAAFLVFFILRADNAAAWVQSIGSLLGIAIAVWVPARHWQLAVKEKREEAMRADYQKALMGLKACLETQEFLEELIKRNAGNRHEWHDKEHFRNAVSSLQQRLATLLAVENNVFWWNLLLNAKALLMELDSSLRLHDIDAGVVRVLAQQRLEWFASQIDDARKNLDSVEEKHKSVLHKGVWEDGLSPNQ